MRLTVNGEPCERPERRERRPPSPMKISQWRAGSFGNFPTGCCSRV